jgi:hypothetical protein
MNPAQKLVEITASIPGLRAREEQLLKSPTLDEDAIYQLLKDGNRLDFRFIIWTNIVPDDWSYISTALDIGSNSPINGRRKYPRNLHAYYDSSVASTWNYWRVNRLLILTIVHRCAVALSYSSKYEVKSVLLSTGTQIQQLVDDICSTVPFHLGYVDKKTGNEVEGQQPRFPHAAGTRPPPEDKDNAVYLQIYHLSGPLSCAMRAPGLDPDQVEWIKEYSTLAFSVRKQKLRESSGSKN